jgi:hypothetical protein
MCFQQLLRMLSAIIEASIARQHSGGPKAAAGRLGAALSAAIQRNHASHFGRRHCSHVIFALSPC